VKPDDWLEILSRAPVPPVPEITPAARCPAAPATFAGDASAQRAAPSAVVWPEEGQVPARFGVRVRSTPDDPRLQAVRLAAAAFERGAEPVILSHVARSGFEQSGFRVERVHGGTAAERAMQEGELGRFWGLAIIVEFDDVTGLV